MLFVYFGENESESRKRYRAHIDDLIKEAYEGFQVNSYELFEYLNTSQTSSLFNRKLLYYGENCLDNNKQEKELLKKIENDSTITVVLWDNQIDPRTIKNRFQKKSLFESKFSASIFTFLDNVKPHNLSVVYKDLQIIKKTNETIKIHYMLTKRLLELLFILKNKPLEGYQQWQIWKLKKQALLWKKETLELFFQTLVRLERQEKSGTTPLSLSKSLDITLCYFLS